MVKVMVALAEGNKSGNDMVSRRFTIVEWLIPYIMGQRIDTECSLLKEEDPENAGVDKSTEPITPTETRNEHGCYKSHEKNDLEVVLTLPE